jgi:hypothetical protein
MLERSTIGKCVVRRMTGIGSDATATPFVVVVTTTVVADHVIGLVAGGVQVTVTSSRFAEIHWTTGANV